MFGRAILALLVICALRTPYTEAVQCYECIGADDDSCSDPFNKDVHTPTGGHDYCIKTKVVHAG